MANARNRKCPGERTCKRLQAQAERRFKETERKRSYVKHVKPLQVVAGIDEKNQSQLDNSHCRSVLRCARDVACSLHTQINHHAVKFQKEILSHVLEAPIL